MAFSFAINNLPSMKGNVTLFSSQAGIAYMSGFAYSTLLKSIQTELKKNSRIYNGRYTLEAKGKSLNMESAKIPNTDYSNIILYYKDFSKKENENSNNETLSFCVFLEIKEEDTRAWSYKGNSESYYTPNLDRFLKQDIEEHYKEELLDIAFNKFYNLCPVPIKKEWTQYLLEKLVKRYFVNALNGMDMRTDKRMYGWHIRARVNVIIEILSDGIRDGDISVSEVKETSDTIKSVTGLDSYLENYKEVLAEKIKENFVPMFNPDIDTYSEELNELSDYIDYIGGLNLYDAQRGVIETTYRTLKKQKSVFIIGSMGTGKTIMAMSACYLHNLSENNNQQMTNIIMCPGHLVEKWKRETETRLPQSKSVIISNFEELLEVIPEIKNKNRGYHLWLVMSKEAAKYGYEERPAAVWKNQKDKRTDVTGYYASPVTGKPIYRYEFEGKGRYRYRRAINLKELDFLKPNKDNYIIEETVPFFNNETKTWDERKVNTKLWQPVNSAIDDDTNWIKMGKVGYVEVNKIRKLYDRLKDAPNKTKEEKQALPELLKILDGEVPIQRAPRKYPIAKYINKFLKGHIDYFIADEIQELKGKESLQGQAFGILLATAKKSLCLTGTLLNGYASSLYYTLFRAFPQLMKQEGFEYSTESEKEFVRAYGVYKTISSWNVAKDRNTGQRTSTKEMPGVSPLIFTKFLLENAVFITQEDMSEAMPGYEEIPIGIDMDSSLKTMYKQIEDGIKTALTRGRTQKMKVMSQVTQLMSVFPDQPYGQKEIISPDNGEVVFTPPVLNKDTYTNKKAEELLRICREKKEAGEKVLVYYHWTNRTDIGTDLPKYLEDNGIKAITMTSSVKSSTREEWIDKKLEEGYDVILCNPSLVETGLDLLAFTTIVFYQMGYNLFTMRQASRRSWRLSQEKDVQVYFLYYKETIQETILSLMASKLQASMAIEGKFTEEGLNAMSNNDDILNQIAMSVTDGIKDTVDVTTFTKVTSESQARVAREQQQKLINIPREFKYEIVQHIVKGKRRNKKNSLNICDALELALA